MKDKKKPAGASSRPSSAPAGSSAPAPAPLEDTKVANNSSTRSSAKTSSKADGSRRRGESSFTGSLRVHPRGFAFLTPDDGGDDVFVPGNLLKGLCDGDRIEVVVRSGSDAATRAKLLHRRRREFVGSVIGRGDRVQLDPGIGIDSFPLSRNCKPGDTLRFRIDSGTAVVEENLGSSEAAGFLRFLMRHEIPRDRSQAVLKEAKSRLKLGPLGQRRDLRSQMVITVDDDSSIDLDDALSARVEADGSVRLWVHIADVAEHIRPGSAIDRAAADVPTSVYLPQGVRHMLPESLGADRLSLLPGRDRDTLCVEFRVDQEGDVRGVDIYEARIRSRMRVNYADAARVLDAKSSDLPGEVVDLLQVLRLAAARLGLLRTARGGLDSVRADQGRQPGADDSSHKMIERLMVATNEAVASWLTDRGAPALWRRHDPISDEQLEEILSVAEGFNLVTGLAAPVSPRSLAVAVSQVPSGNAGSAFWDALLGVLGRAYYSTNSGGHFGLASEGYLHFTSPLRRYPDLMVHRVVKAYIAGRRNLESLLPELAATAARANEVFHRASQAERDATLAAGLEDISVGDVLSAIVIGRSRNGSRVRLERPGVVAPLPGNRRPGERLRVEVVKVDPYAGRVELKAVPGK